MPRGLSKGEILAYIHFDAVRVVFLKKTSRVLMHCFYDSDLNFGMI